jgi:hypothetical protein
MKAQKTPIGDDRTSIINAVRTPLGFFVFAVLVLEGILGMLSGLAFSGTDRSEALHGMFALIGVLIALVAILAVFRPEALVGARKDGKLEARLEEVRATAERTQAENDKLRDGFHCVEEQNDALRAENVRLSEAISRIDSLTSRIRAILLARGSADLSQIMNGLDIHFRGPAYDQVLGVLGSLAREGEIQRDERIGGDYYMLTKR